MPPLKLAITVALLLVGFVHEYQGRRLSSSSNSVFRPSISASERQRTRSAPSLAPVMSVVAEAETVKTLEGVAVRTGEIAKLFGRFAEKVLYLDKEVGDCCYSGCTDCEWRNPEGGYRFPLLRAARPKWIPCYLSRCYDVGGGGCHTPQWVKTLFPNGIELDAKVSISRADFETRLRQVKFVAPMGPTGMIQPKEADPSREAVDLFWAWLCNGPDDTELVPSQILKRLQDMSQDEDRDGAIGEGPDSVDWQAFAKALGVDPSERC